MKWRYCKDGNIPYPFTELVAETYNGYKMIGRYESANQQIVSDTSVDVIKIQDCYRWFYLEK